MSDIFIIEGHGAVNATAPNIKVTTINKMRKSGDVSFYNVGIPAQTTTAGIVSAAILETVNNGFTAGNFYHEGTFKKDRVDYLTTSIQDKHLEELSKKEWLIKDFIEAEFNEILDVDYVKFYKHNTKNNLYYIRVARGHEKVTSLGEILSIVFVKKIFKGNSRKFIWAACRAN